VRRLSAALVLLLSACAGNVDDVDRELARVDAHRISVGDFERSYVNALLQSGANDTPEQRWSHLDGLLNEYLLSEEARHRGLDRDSLAMGFKQLAMGKALGGRYYEQAFLRYLPSLDEVSLRLAFARFKQPLIVRHLLYHTKADAEAAYERLNAGRAFLVEAQDCFRTAAFDSMAGYLGEVRYFQADDTFAEAAFALPVGGYSAPVRSRHGFHIIKVEDRLSAPILTETEFQMRRAGMASLLRLRQRRLLGDQFVRAFMDSLNVQVDADGVRALQAALNRLELRAGRTPVVLSDADSPAPSELEPETVVATYLQSGSRHAFTVEDYAFWLPDLPFAEAVNRTAASVGRALRNEAFAQAGRQAGLENSPQVTADVNAELRTFLAGTLRLRTTDSTLVTELRRKASMEVDSTLFNQIMTL